MALLWIEGFEGVGTTIGSTPSPTGVLARKYAVTDWLSSMSVQNGRIAGYAIRMDSAGPLLRTGALTTDATMVVGGAFRFTSFAAATFLCFYDGTTLGMNLCIGADGEISIRRGTSILETTSGLGIVTGAWYYIEFKVVCGASGSYELRIGEVTKASASGVNTKAGTHEYHTSFQLAAWNNNLYMDDIYCLDGSGTRNNDFLGNQKVLAIFPSGDVTSDFTTSAGSDHYTLVDENPANDDTDYVEDSTSGHTDLWNYRDPTGAGVIAGIQINTMARETDATSFSLKSVVQSDVTEDEGTAEAIGGTSYRVLRRIVEKDPHTNLPWTSDGIDAAKFGVRVG
jgi:hypothetical protein